MESKSHFSPDRRPEPSQLRSVSYVSEVLRHMARKADTSADSTANLDSVNELLANQGFIDTHYNFGVRGQKPLETTNNLAPVKVLELQQKFADVYVPLAHAIVFDIFPITSFANTVNHMVNLIDHSVSVIGPERTRLICLDRIIRGSEGALIAQVKKHSNAAAVYGPTNPGDATYWEKEVVRFVTHVGNISGHEIALMNSLRSLYDRRVIPVAQELIRTLHTLKMTDYSRGAQSRSEILQMLCTDLKGWDEDSIKDFIQSQKMVIGRVFLNR